MESNFCAKYLLACPSARLLHLGCLLSALGLGVLTVSKEIQKARVGGRGDTEKDGGICVGRQLAITKVSFGGEKWESRDSASVMLLLLPGICWLYRHAFFLRIQVAKNLAIVF
eukprot:15366389-Ditylum_brightwellii.AAC.2